MRETRHVVPSDTSIDYKDGDVNVLDDQKINKAKLDDEKMQERLLQRIKQREKKYSSYYDDLKKRTERNRKYWKGDQIDDSKLYEGEQAITVNKIFTSIETIVPIATRRTPEPNVVVYPRYKNSSRLLEDKLTRYLKDKWNIFNKMPQKMQKGVRNLLQSGYGIGKYYWDEDRKEMAFKLLPPTAIMFPNEFEDMQEAPFVIEYVRSTVNEMCEKFSDKKEEIYNQISIDGIDAKGDAIITYIEYWENDIVCWKFRDVLLEVRRNPNWDWKEATQDEQGKPTYKPKNHFDVPQKPYIQLNFLGLGENIADETTLVDQTVQLQDSVNKRKRTVELNAEFANGKYIVAGNAMTAEDFGKLSHKTYKVYLENADTVAGAMDVFYGRSLDQGIFQDQKDSENHIDNVFGTHSTTRGERVAQETATGRAILKESDTGRIDIITINLEQFAEEYYNAEIQLIKLNLDERYDIYTEPEGFDSDKVTAEDKQMYLMSEELEDVRVFVKVEEGSVAVQDKAMRRAEAVDLTQSGLMWAGDMYKELGYSNAHELAKNAFLAQADPIKLYPELENPEKFEPEAILHIEKILGGEDPDAFDSIDINEYQKHVDTHTDYMRGIEIHEDLFPYNQLSIDEQEKIREHLEMETVQLQELLSQQQVDPMQQIAQMMPPVTPDGGAGLPPETPLAGEQPIPPELTGGMPPQGLTPMM